MGHIFISYSKKDVVYAEKLINALKNEGFDPWVDMEGLQVGTPWRIQLHKQLKTCDAYLLIVSQNSKDSTWVHEELDFAQHFNKPIFPLRLDDTEPFFGIRAIQYEDIRQGKLPSEAFYQQLEIVTSRRKKTRRQNANSTDQAKKQVMEGAAQLLSYYGKELSDLISRASKGLTDTKKTIENSDVIKKLSANAKKTAPKKKKNTIKKVPSSAKKTASPRKKKK